MLKRECEIRNSSAIGERFNELAGDDGAIQQMLLDIQVQVCEEFGFGETGPIALQSARARFPDDADVVNSAFYLKYNRSRQGGLTVGDEVPDVPLLNLDGSTTSLLDYYRNCTKTNTARPLVLVAGSRT
jgi:hypothetical protein